MPKLRKSANGQRRGYSKLIKEMEKLAAALERNALHGLANPFRNFEATTEVGACLGKPEAA